MKFTKRFLAMLSCIAILGIGLAFILKAAVGIGPYDAVAQSVANITGIMVGTVTMILNTFFIVMQVAIKRKKFNPVQLLQFVVIFAFGSIVNFFLYQVLTFEVDSYLFRLSMFIFGTVIGAFGVAGVMNINVVYTPLEGFLSALSEVTNGDFVKFRMGFDLFSIVLTLILAFSFNIPLAIREGTIISAIFFSPIMGWFMKMQIPLLKKLNLLVPADDEILDQIDII